MCACEHMAYWLLAESSWEASGGLVWRSFWGAYWGTSLGSFLGNALGTYKLWETNSPWRLLRCSVYKFVVEAPCLSGSHPILLWLKDIFYMLSPSNCFILGQVYFQCSSSEWWASVQLFVTFMIISAEILFFVIKLSYISSILIEAAASLIKTKSKWKTLLTPPTSEQ